MPGLTLTALVLNGRGLDRALAVGMKHLSMSVSAAEDHSRANLGRSRGSALEAMTGLIEMAVGAGIKVRGGIQCAFGHLAPGDVSPERVTEMARVLALAGAREINLADTPGLAQGAAVGGLVARVARAVPGVTLSLHLHHGPGEMKVKLAAGYEAGARIFDVALGGRGRCPALAGAGGNLATQDAAAFFKQQGRLPGPGQPEMDLERLDRTAGLVSRMVAQAEQEGGNI